eukprot:GILJ01007631.1.p1 GENE.GILJ01007631.1~~GILJ01007631.1.p1  ORF type:complete len:415 (+),score=2.09 GILJ01007631.1:85-1245(+)
MATPETASEQGTANRFGPRQQCPICFESKKPRHLITLDCKHVCCTSCMQQWARVLIRDGHNLQPWMRCPKTCCGTPVSENLYLNLLSAKDRMRLEKILLRSALSSMEDVRVCPAVNCHYAGFVDTAGCHDFICAKCFTTWKDATNLWTLPPLLVYLNRVFPVTAFVALMQSGIQEWKSGVWKRFNTKRCPQCRVEIQKNGGCNHMSCARCGYQWCWRCDCEWIRHDINRCNRPSNTVLLSICLLAFVGTYLCCELGLFPVLQTIVSWFFILLLGVGIPMISWFFCLLMIRPYPGASVCEIIRRNIQQLLPAAVVLAFIVGLFSRTTSGRKILYVMTSTITAHICWRVGRHVALKLEMASGQTRPSVRGMSPRYRASEPLLARLIVG